jgi:hypothetical protein
MIEDSNLVINQEEECHKVKAYSMKAIKYLGNSIMCDDRERVTIIDPNTMDIIGSVPKIKPIEYCDLNSAYKLKNSNTLLMAFDIKKIISVECSRYT